ncbi:hypothetical protein FOZ63_029639, partial [Perkinsus olseni]
MRAAEVDGASRGKLLVQYSGDTNSAITQFHNLHVVNMATPDEQAELSRARQGLATTSRSLRDTRETVNNIIPDDEDDTNQLLADLAAKGKDLLAQVSDFEARIAELEALADRSISRREGISRISPHEEEAFVSPLEQTSAEVRKRSTEATSSRPSRSAASVTKLCLPQLCEPSDLQSHYEAIEHTLVEAGAADYGEEGRLSVHSEVKVSETTKFPATLSSVRTVHKRAMAAARIDDFLEAASEVFHIFVDIFPKDLAERQALTRQMLSKLPQTIIEQVVDRIRHMAGITSPGEDWGTALPFDEALDGVSSVCEVIRLVCRTKDEAITCDSHEDTDDDTNPVKQADSVAAVAQCQATYRSEVDYSEGVVVRKSSHGKTLQQKQQINEGIDKLLSSGFVGYI